MDRKLNYCKFELCKKTASKKTYYTRNNTFSKSIENDHFSQNSKAGTKRKFSKIADSLVELRKAKKIGNKSRTIA